MTPMISAGYAALLAILLVILSVHTIRQRRRGGIALGDGGDRALMRAMRAHGNFTEYVPLALLLLVLVEWVGYAAWCIHLLGLMLVMGRILHAYGITKIKENFRFRIIGMSLTFGVLIIASILLLLSLIRHLFQV